MLVPLLLVLLLLPPGVMWQASQQQHAALQCCQHPDLQLQQLLPWLLLAQGCQPCHLSQQQGWHLHLLLLLSG